MVETPAALIGPLLQLLVMYWGIGYMNFLQVYLIMILVAQNSIGIGLTISSCANDMTSATAVAPLFTMPMILFGGFIANTESIPGWLGWIQYTSPIRYAVEAFAHTQLDEDSEVT